MDPMEARCAEQSECHTETYSATGQETASCKAKPELRPSHPYLAVSSPRCPFQTSILARAAYPVSPQTGAGGVCSHRRHEVTGDPSAGTVLRARPYSRGEPDRPGTVPLVFVAVIALPFILLTSEGREPIRLIRPARRRWL